MIANVGRLEVVKWAAFLAMVADHVGLVVYDGEVAWLHAVGRFAFPAFALCFGLGLAQSADPARVARRLVLPALLAQAAWQLIDPGHRVNVLAVFAAVAFVVWVWEIDRVIGAMCAAFLLYASIGTMEGGPLGVGLALAGVIAGRIGSVLPLAPAGALWLLGGVTPGALLGVVVPALWPVTVSVPRHKGLLMWAYPAHLGVLAAVSAVVA